MMNRLKKTVFAGIVLAALDAVKQWLYEPVVVDGKPKAVKFTVTIRFKLE